MAPNLSSPEYAWEVPKVYVGTTLYFDAHLVKVGPPKSKDYTHLVNAFQPAYRRFITKPNYPDLVCRGSRTTKEDDDIRFDPTKVMAQRHYVESKQLILHPVRFQAEKKLCIDELPPLWIHAQALTPST